MSYRWHEHSSIFVLLQKDVFFSGGEFRRDRGPWRSLVWRGGCREDGQLACRFYISQQNFKVPSLQVFQVSAAKNKGKRVFEKEMNPPPDHPELVAADAEILDVGCGNGLLTVDLAKEGFQVKTYGDG